MLLSELDTPFERRRCIEYSLYDRNKVVRHWHNLQHMYGNLWRTKPEPGKYGWPDYNVYLFFDGENGCTDGFRVAYKDVQYPGDDIDKYSRTYSVNGYDDYAHYASMLENLMERDIHIGLGWIEFVRQFDPAFADKLTAYRSERNARKAAERAAHIAAIEEKERQEKEEREAKAKKELAENYLGWADNLTPMQLGRARKTLEKRVRVDHDWVNGYYVCLNGKVMTRREFVINAVKSGHYPGLGREGTYRLYTPDGKLFYTINKTMHDFAVYLSGKINDGGKPDENK